MDSGVRRSDTVLLALLALLARNAGLCWNNFMTPYDPHNVFGKILRAEIPCTKLYENDVALAFSDIRPQAPVHALVIPKGAYVDATDFCAHASTAEVEGFWRAVGAVVQQLGLSGDGYRLIANTGADGGQEVPHFHIHILGGKNLGRMVG